MKNKDKKQYSNQPGRRGEKPPAKTPATNVSADTQNAAGGERIAKRLARAGVASRRDAEAMIEAGRVTVNGQVLKTPAHNVHPSDRIEVDDAPIPVVERTRLFLFHKPAGFVTTSRDPEGRKTIFDILPKSLPRLVTVGRLDMSTEGLLLLTNDGGLARVLELPSTGWLRRYRVRVHGHVDPLTLAELEHGMAVDGVFYGAIEATLDRKQGSNAWLTLGLREGKNREVKNVLGALGLEVTRLLRVSYGPFQLGDLPEGAVQEIKGQTLRDQLGARLIEEAGANFDAPIVRPFTNKPVRGEAQPAQEPARKTGDRSAKPEKGRKPINRKKEREAKREEMRGRLQTKRPAGQNQEKRPKQPLERRSRAANVWMAPGARPTAGKRPEDDASERPAPKGHAARKAAPPAERSRKVEQGKKNVTGQRPARAKPRPGGGSKRS